MRRHPVALGFAALCLVVGVLSGSVSGAPRIPVAAGVQEVLQGGQGWTLLTALLAPSSVVGALVTVAFSLTLLAAAETVLGTWRALIALVGLGGISVAVGVTAQAALWTVAGLRPFETAPAPVADPLIAVSAAVMFASAEAPALWRRRVRLIGMAVLAVFALYAGDAASWYRLTAALIGLLAGMLLLRPSRPHAWHRSSLAETRSLLATLVAVAAVGPFAALLTDGGHGPLSRVADLFSQVDQHLAAACARHYFAACDQVTVAVVTRGAGPALVALVPLTLLLVGAWGLAAGRRAAVILVLAVLAGLVAHSVLLLTIGVDAREYGDPLDVTVALLGDLVFPAALAVAVFRSRRAFTIRADRAVVRRAAIAVVATAVVVVGVSTLMAVSFRRDFDASVAPGGALLDALRRLVPIGLRIEPGPLVHPHGGPALFAYQWTGVLFWAVVIVLLVRVLRSRGRLPDSDGTLYRALLRRGGGTVSWWGTWEGNRYWYADDLQSAVAYRLVGDVALAVGGPVGAPEHGEDALDGFIAMCVAHDWAVAFYSIGDEYLPALDRRGWAHFPVAEETLVDLDGFDLVGKAWQKVRQPVVRAEREGMRAVWSRWSDLPSSVTAQIVELSEAWVSEKALPEMRFTLGGLAEASDPDVAVMVAVDAQDRVQGVTSWMPVWRDGALVGRTLDFMRRRMDGPNGVMEFLIAKTALRGAADGLSFLSLSGAPLAVRAERRGDAATALDVFLVWLAATLEPVYGFASLFRFKAKFHPRYEGLHLAYGDPLALPRIGVAIARAYLPDARRRDVLTLVRGGRP